MNRRGFLRAALATGITAVAANAGLSKVADGGIEFLLGEMTKGARRIAPREDDAVLLHLKSTTMDNFGMSIYLDDIEGLAKDAQAICDAINPVIDAIATLEEVELPRIGRVSMSAWNMTIEGWNV